MIDKLIKKKLYNHNNLIIRNPMHTNMRKLSPFLFSLLLPSNDENSEINHCSHQLMHTSITHRPVCMTFSFSIERIVVEKKDSDCFSLSLLFSRLGLTRSQRNWNSNEGGRVYTEFPQDSLHHRLFTGRYNHRGHRNGFMARTFEPGTFEVLYQPLISVFTSSKVNSDRINGFLG